MTRPLSDFLRPLRGVALASAALVPLVAPAASSAAGVVTKSGGTVTVTAGSGDANALKVYNSGTAFIVEDKTTLQLTAGANCFQLLAYRVACTDGGVARIDVFAGDGNDSVDVNVAVDANLFGESGTDTLKGVGAGKKVFGGGSGTGDTVTWAGTTTTVFATIDNLLNDGPLDGAPDFVGADVETLVGSSANDYLRAGSAAAWLFGGPGNDTLVGGAGGDILVGDAGLDTLEGNGGNDSFFTKDGVSGEQITCGAGYDTVFPDSNDVLTDVGSCESAIF